MRNDLTIYDKVADSRWSDDIRLVRTQRNLVPGRLACFDPQIDWRGKSVLNLGFAGGFMAEALEARGAHAPGIDPAEGTIAATHLYARQRYLRIGYEVDLGEALPCDDASFDAVVCVDMLEREADLTKLMAEVTRALHPGGLFLFDTINLGPASHHHPSRGPAAPIATWHG